MGITEPQEVQEFALFLIKEKSKLGDGASRWGHSPAQGRGGLVSAGVAGQGVCGLSSSGPRLPMQASWCGPCSLPNTSTAW